MNRTYHAAQVSLALSVFILASGPCPAETPGQIPQPWTYEGSKKLQEQQPQQDQPIFQPPGTSPQGGARMAPMQPPPQRRTPRAASGKVARLCRPTAILCWADGCVPRRPAPILTIPSAH